VTVTLRVTVTATSHARRLGLFANQAAIAVDLPQKARRAERVLADEDDLSVVAGLAAAVNALEDEQRAAGLRLLRNLAATLGRGEGV
jgi:hypothetical protein